MPKIVVTYELADTIRTLRLEKKITVTALSEHIHKSKSYITKLEKGDIKTLSRSDLDQIIDFILSSNRDDIDRINTVLKAASYRYSAQELEEQVWFSNYSTVYCNIPVPEQLVDKINDLLFQNNISYDALRARINANEFLPDDVDEEGLSSINPPYNEWFEYKGKERSLIILLHISIDQLEKILTKQTTVSNYIFMHAIVQYIFKIIEYGDQVIIGKAEAEGLYRKAEQLLHEFNFYSLSEKYRRIHASEQLSQPDQQNQNEIAKVNKYITIRSELNVQRMNTRLSALNRNLEWDGPFMERIMTLPFADLGDASFSFKNQLITRIQEALKEALAVPDEEKQVDSYDD